MTQSFATARRYLSLATVVTGCFLGAVVLVAPPAAAQDVGDEECEFVCGIVTEGGGDSVLADPPAYPDLVGPNNIDEIYAGPETTPPPPGPLDPSVDPYIVDTDGDGVPDGYEGVDSDYDGVWDWYEIYVYGTDPYTADQPMRSEGGSEVVPPDENSDEDCTYATPNTCFPASSRMTTRPNRPPMTPSSFRA